LFIQQCRNPFCVYVVRSFRLVPMFSGSTPISPSDEGYSRSASCALK